MQSLIHTKIGKKDHTTAQSHIKKQRLPKEPPQNLYIMYQTFLTS